MFGILRVQFVVFLVVGPHYLSFFFFFNDTATTEIYTLSLHDALPISRASRLAPDRTTTQSGPRCPGFRRADSRTARNTDRKSTRLNSSHLVISYAVFCLKKKKKLERYPVNLTLDLRAPGRVLADLMNA